MSDPSPIDRSYQLEVETREELPAPQLEQQLEETLLALETVLDAVVTVSEQPQPLEDGDGEQHWFYDGTALLRMEALAEQDPPQLGALPGAVVGVRLQPSGQPQPA